MKIDSIKLNNFRQYRDVKIAFNDIQNDKNFYIIQGPNGAGKSNILNAVTWCLYKEEVRIDKSKKGLPLINTKSFDNLKTGESDEVYVEICMIDKKGKKHILKRLVEIKKDNNGLPKICTSYEEADKDGTLFEYFREEKNDLKRLDYPVDYLEQLMPSNIKEYFFFDGDNLNAYFKEKSGEKIREAVFDICQISILENLYNRLNLKKRDIHRVAKNISPETADLQKNIENLNKKLEENNKNLTELKNEYFKQNNLKKEVNKELIQFRESAQLQEEKEQIEKDMEINENELDELIIESSTNLLETAPYIIAYNAIQHTEKLINDKMKKGKYPPDIKLELLEKLLKEKTCICGASLEDKSAKAKIEKLINQISISNETTNEIISMQGILATHANKIKPFKNRQVNINKKINRLEKENQKLEERKKFILKKLQNTPKERIQRLAALSEEIDIKIAETNRNIGRIEIEIDTLEKEIKAKEKNLEKEIRKRKQHQDLSRALNFLKNVLNAIEDIKNKIMSEVRKKIEKKTKDQFFSLIWNPKEFKDILIDQDYNVSVLDKESRECIGTLSEGQRQVLALSFMAALKQVSGFDVPVIIDTPLGRISKEPKKNIANNLPNYLEGNQVIMLVTEEEYSEDVRKRLKCRVCNEYKIDFKETEAKVINFE